MMQNDIGWNKAVQNCTKSEYQNTTAHIFPISLNSFRATRAYFNTLTSFCKLAFITALYFSACHVFGPKCLGIFWSQTHIDALFVKSGYWLFFFFDSVSIRICFSKGGGFKHYCEFSPWNLNNDEPPILDLCILSHGWWNNLTNKFLDDCIACHLFSKLCPDVCWLRGVFAAPRRLGWLGGSWWIFSGAIGFINQKKHIVKFEPACHWWTFTTKPLKLTASLHLKMEAVGKQPPFLFGMVYFQGRSVRFREGILCPVSIWSTW